MSLNSVSTGFTRQPLSIISIGQEEDPLVDKKFLRCLGQIIRDARKQKGMTQERLSEIAGVSAKYLSEVEQGRGNVTVLLLRRVARALKLDLCALLYGCEDNSEERRLRREIADQLQKLRPQELRRAARILRAIGENEDRAIE